MKAVRWAENIIDSILRLPSLQALLLPSISELLDSEESLGSTIISYGEALWDLLPTGPVLGGAPLNFAYRLNSLGHRSLIVSRLGDDELGQKARDQIISLGMDDTFLQMDATYPTGTVEIFLNEDKDPDYNIIENVAYDYIENAGVLEKIIESADCLCFGTLAQRNPVSRKTLKSLILKFSGRYVLLDINLRKNCYTGQSIKDSLQQANVLKINNEELAVLADLLALSGRTVPDRAESLLNHALLEYCVITLGERGAYAISNNGRKIYSPGYKVNLIDPCGSGDGFTAGFIHSLLQNKSMQEACRLGNAIGAMVARQEGATRPISYEEITAFMKANQPEVIDAKLTNFMH